MAKGKRRAGKSKRRGREIADAARPPEEVGRQVYPPMPREIMVPTTAPQVPPPAPPPPPPQAAPQGPMPVEPAVPPRAPAAPESIEGAVPPQAPQPPPRAAPPQPTTVEPPAPPEVPTIPPLIEEAIPPQAPPVTPSPGEAAEPVSEEAPYTGEVPPPGEQQVPYYQPQEYFGQGYYWPHPSWYPPYPPPGQGYGPGFPPPPEAVQGYEYGPGYPPPAEQTGPMPVVPPGPPPPGIGPPLPMPPDGVYQPYPPGIAPALAEPMKDEEDFRELTRAQTTSHWRGDFKWVFGLITAFLLFSAITLAALYRVTGPGASREVVVPLIDRTTMVKQLVKENYMELRSKARKNKEGDILIPGIGIEVRIGGAQITSLSSEDLAEMVMLEVERELYNDGYKGNLPAKKAFGVGEERGRAVSDTFLSMLNRRTHKNLVWPLVVLGGLSLAFGILFLICCRGWGKVQGAGLVLMGAALPGSLFMRLGNEFVWSSASGIYKAAMYGAFRGTSDLMLAYYDIALGAGALLLLVGVIGGVVARRARERVPPFTELKRPVKPVAGGPPVQPGLLPDVPEGDESTGAGIAPLLPPETGGDTAPPLMASPEDTVFTQTKNP